MWMRIRIDGGYDAVRRYVNRSCGRFQTTFDRQADHRLQRPLPVFTSRKPAWLNFGQTPN
jgi:hypothetical protein